MRPIRCPKCGNRDIMKWGTRPIIRKGVSPKEREQAWLCKNPACYHQWRE